MNDFLEKIKNIPEKWSALTPNKKLYAALSVGAVAALIGFIVIMSGSSGYEILYADLDPDQVDAIGRKLSEMGIPYRIQQQGKTILVPLGQKQAVVVALSSEGFPQKVKNGYKDLDTSQWGQTELMQKISIIRAREGELEKTLSKLREVDQARVHLAIPDKSLFKEEQEPVTAAVFLKLKPNAKLDRERVEVVKYMISSSIENLKPENITITDSDGNLLARGGEQETELYKSEERLATRRKIEHYLEEKALSIIADAIGWDKARVKISVNLDYEQVEKTIETYDPDKVAIRSEERREESSGTGGNGAETNITNYEINRKVEHIVQSTGNIISMSAAVLVDGKMEESAGGANTYVPRTAEELDQLASLVKNAIGFDDKRGDTFEIINLPFDTSASEQAMTEIATSETLDFVRDLSIKILILVLVLGLFFTVKKRISNIHSEIDSEELPPPPEETPDNRKAKLAQLLPLDDITEEDEQLRLLQEEIVEFAKEDPDSTASFIKAWLLED